MNITDTLSAKAKINLRLKITGRRGDGYHLLSMINVTCDLADKIEITLNETGKVEVLSDIVFGDPKNNIASVAAEQFFKRAELRYGACIKIDKNIPIGGGLGGGSSDAAAVLNYLSNTFGEFPFITPLALELGADVPYAMHGGLALVEGVGEKITPIRCDELNGLRCLLINPGYGVNTKQAFKDLNWGERKMPDLKIDKQLSLKQLFELVENDFINPEDPFQKAVLKVAKDSGNITSLSGTGSTMFVLANHKDQDLLVLKNNFLNKLGNINIIVTKICTKID